MARGTWLSSCPRQTRQAWRPARTARTTLASRRTGCPTLWTQTQVRACLPAGLQAVGRVQLGQRSALLVALELEGARGPCPPRPGSPGALCASGGPRLHLRRRQRCPVPCRQVQLQTALLGHHQPAGQHLRQQGPLHQRVPLAAGRPPPAPVQLQPRAVRPAAPLSLGRQGLHGVCQPWGAARGAPEAWQGGPVLSCCPGGPGARGCGTQDFLASWGWGRRRARPRLLPGCVLPWEGGCSPWGHSAWLQGLAGWARRPL